jgi:4-diphosphocytidyl-2C-methyl-D-erythritol kinase
MKETEIRELTLKAYAKINLVLDITGRRPDGYHDLASVMQEIGLYDTITIRKTATGIKLKVDEDAIDYIVDKAVEYKLGARGLRSITERIMMNAMFESPSKNIKTFTLTKDYAAKELAAAGEFHKQ